MRLPTEEKFMLEVTRFRDHSGNETCAVDFLTGRICEFYRTIKMGGAETCVFAPDTAGKYHTELLERRDGGEGTLIPGTWCRVWQKEPSCEESSA